MNDSLERRSAELSADEVVRAAVAALESGRWADVPPLVSPNALTEFRSSQAAALLELARRVPRTPEQIQNDHPGISPELARHHAGEERIWQERGMPVLLNEWGLRDASDLETLADAEFLTRFLAATSPVARLRGAWAVRHTPVDDPVAEASRNPPHVRWKVLGSVVEDDRYAHVLFRQFWGSEGNPDDTTGLDRVRVTTLDRTPMGWRLRIDSSLLAQQYGFSAHHAEEAGSGEQAHGTEV